MEELVRTNDLVLLSALSTLLDAAGFDPVVFDQHTAAVEGSIGMLPRRLMVPGDEAARARAFLTEAGYAAELRPWKA